MTYVSEPKVYLVTRPSVDWAQVAAFQKHGNFHPLEDVDGGGATPRRHGRQGVDDRLRKVRVLVLLDDDA